MLRILIVDPLSRVIKESLEKKFPDVSVTVAGNEAEAMQFVEEAEVLSFFKVSDALMAKARNLKWIQAMTTGTDYIFGLPSLPKDVIVTSTRGIHGPQMSEIAIMLMLALNRGLPKVVRNQDAHAWDRWPGKLLWKKKVGILGSGVCAEAIALKCKTFEMEVHCIGTVQREIPGVDQFHLRSELHNVLGNVDYFIIVAPNTPENQNLIDAAALAGMKPDAFLINIGRGEIIDESALLSALKEKKIAGAALDTFITEPLPQDSPFWDLDNVLITPHLGGMSDIYAEQVLTVFEENLKRYLAGERTDLVNMVSH
jgi:D-2-hydroxyacid dehydrogenase (NADP+)